MCGRYTLRRLELILMQLGLARGPWEQFAARFNVAPSYQMPVVRQAKGDLECVALEWGLVPGWAKDPKQLPYGPQINARSETVASSNFFRKSADRRRCAVPVDGFYEWRRGGKIKQPFYIRRKDDAPFFFAGVWDVWQRDGVAARETFAVLTTSPNQLMQPIHNRMPVILPRTALQAWLDETVPYSNVAALATACEWEEMEAYPVSTRVNRPANDDPACIEPAAPAPAEPKGLFD